MAECGKRPISFAMELEPAISGQLAASAARAFSPCEKLLWAISRTRQQEDFGRNS
jgi:hypothetical protein